jgi:hypothetical protein
MSLSKILSGANAREISDIQEDETEVPIRRSECNMDTLSRKTMMIISGEHNSGPIQGELAA